jgi:hypothetical protein
MTRNRNKMKEKLDFSKVDKEEIKKEIINYVKRNKLFGNADLGICSG